MTASRKYSSEKQEFSLGPYQFCRDAREQLVQVPAGPDLIGYLALDVNRNLFAQVRLLKSADNGKRAFYKDFWRQQTGEKTSAIHPKVLAYGEEETIPYYICNLPEAEPISLFSERNGPIPPENAVRLVLTFIHSLKDQKSISPGSHLIHPDMLWITGGASDPQIILGDFNPIPFPDAEVKNAALCSDLLKFLSGNPPFTEWFQDLMELIDKGPGTINHLTGLLQSAAGSHPAEPYWTEFNKPCPILHQLISPEEVVPIPLRPIPCDQKRFWPSKRMLGIAAGTLLLVTLAFKGLPYLNADKSPATVETKPKIQEPAPQLAIDQEFTEKAAAPLIDPPLPPLLPPPSPKSLPVVAKEPALATGDAPVPSAEVEKPTTAEDILAQIAREAARARAANQIVWAIDKEIDYLKIDPKSVEARLRLDQDLQILQRSPDPGFSGDDISILQRATDFNPKVHDLLVKHFRHIGDREREIDSLIQYGKSGRPDKLREAGERIFQNPTANWERQVQARELFIEAASSGDGGAQFFAGECMILGRGGDKNLARGASYLIKAVDQGDARAMDLLGVCYVRGWGVTVNDIRAIEMFQAAVDNGNIPAYYNLGARYAQGKGATRDPVKAADIFAAGSEKGNPDCMLVYARCLESGYGREQDIEKAIYWFSKSAEKGNTEAIEWCEEKQIDFLKVVADS